MRRTTVVFTALALSAVFGRPARAGSAAQPAEIRIELRDVRITELTLEGLNIAFSLTLSNATAVPQNLVRARYRAVIDEVEYLDLGWNLDEPIRVEPKGRTSIVLPLKITYAYLFETVPGVQSRGKGACLLTGEMAFEDERRREKRALFALTADFPIFRGLDVRLLPLEARGLTIGGTEAVFRAVIVNPNGFDVTVESLPYRLEIAGKPVAAGPAVRRLAVDGGREKEFSAPLLLDFFELGRGVYESFIQPPVAVRLSGTASLATPWGTFEVRLDRSEKVAVKTPA